MFSTGKNPENFLSDVGGPASDQGEPDKVLPFKDPYTMGKQGGTQTPPPLWIPTCFTEAYFQTLVLTNHVSIGQTASKG